MDTGGGLRVDVLGPLHVEVAGTAVEVAGARVRALLVRLALAEGHPVAVGSLVRSLWESDAPLGELNALQSLVSRLRRALGAAAAVEQSPAGYRLQMAPTDLDVRRFRDSCARGRSRLTTTDAAVAVPAFSDALALWRGPAAPEVDLVEPGLAGVLEAERTDARTDLAEALLGAGRAGAALPELAALRRDRPSDERLAALEIRALVAVGRVGDALRSYDRLRRALADELGIDPSPVVQAAHRLALQADAASPTPVPPLPRPSEPADRGGTHGNLPSTRTSFVGRSAELDRVEQTLQRGRLATVLGPGGAGKTRLSLEAAHRLRDGGRRDIWFVELAGVIAEADVPQAVLAALGIRETALLDQRAPNAVRPARETLELLVEHVGDRPTLLVLDNCEHVIGAAASLVDALLAACPTLQVLATSREPLAIDGEFLVPLAPLAVPGHDQGPDEPMAPAVELFVDRARAIAPDFTLDAATTPAVEEIVRRLDGLPLAIELAAARLRTVAVGEIAERLSDRFRLLTSGDRTADPRHRTLRAVVAWSWDLLDPDERLLAERVAVFPAGLTTTSAVAACGDPSLQPRLDRAAIPDLLDALVDKSLVGLDRRTGRYRVLETIREYGHEQLAVRGEADAVRLSAARHVAGLVAEADPYLRGPEQVRWLDLLRAEHDNVIAALRAFCDLGCTDDALTLVLDFGWFWFLFGRYTDAGTWAETVLQLPGGEPELREAAEVLSATVQLEGRQRLEVASSVVEQCRHVLENGAGRPLVLLFAPLVLQFADEADAARRGLDRIVAGDDPWLAASARMIRTRIAENAGDVATVHDDVEAALATFRSLGDRWGVANTLPTVAQLRMYDGDLEAALAALTEAAEVTKAFGGATDADDGLFLALRTSDIQMRLGAPAAALEALDAARADVYLRGSVEPRVIVDAMTCDLHRHLGDLERAAAAQREADDGIRNGPDNRLFGGHGVALVDGAGTMLDLALGDLASARTRLMRAHSAGLRSQDQPIQAFVGVAAADLALTTGAATEALTLLGASARLRGADDPTALDVRRVRRAATALLPGDADAREVTAERLYLDGRDLSREQAAERLDPARLR